MSSSETHVITVDPDGIEFVYDDRLQFLCALGQTTVRRVSHVEPVLVDGEWQWTADMTPGGANVMLGPFKTREEALQQERRWLEG